MKMRLEEVTWEENSPALEQLLKEDIHFHVMKQGFEAEVVRLQAGDEDYVLKIWNKQSNPDVAMQYRLLQALCQRGASASRPLGWGVTPQGHKAMLTTYDGTPITIQGPEIMTSLAKMLSDIHHMTDKDIDQLGVPAYRLIEYFFEDIHQHEDLNRALLLTISSIEAFHNDRIIHGDYHVNNIVERDGTYTIIDWTNAQRGDARYDFAWASLLIHIYLPDGFGHVFDTAYLGAHSLEEQELAAFQGLACLRWILLYRGGHTPLEADTELSLIHI